MLGLSPVVEHGLGRFVPPNGDDNPFAWLTAQRIILAGVAAVQHSAAAAAGASATVSAAGWPAARLRPDAPLGPPQFTSTLDQLTVASFHPHHQRDHSGDDRDANNKYQDDRHNTPPSLR